nr:HNH endonuclease [Pseudenhygromyxa sp. WMMC2535]
MAGKCIHCKRKLAVDLTGQPIANETVEHIVPRTHGGTDAVENLAIACSRCNQGKGSRLDHRPWSDPTLQAVISTLRARRRARMRPPLAGLELPPLSPPDQDTAPADSAQRGRGTKSRGRRGR